ncbi:MAG: class I SAM-dependent methyltransferase [Flammeovirgaceae bacterium]
MIKLHKNLLEAVIKALQNIFEERRYADQVIEQILKSNPKWGARDRAFIAETTYEMVRWWRLLWELLELSPSPVHYWKAVGVWLFLKKYELPEWTEFQDVHYKRVLYLEKQFQKIRKIKESIPDWLDELGEKELGEKWTATIQKLNEPAELVIRANRLKTSVKELQKKLESEKVIATPYLEDALIIHKRQNIFKTICFQEGLFEVQDFSSQQVAQMLDAQAGMRIVDACAGAGGKTLHIAALMNNKGKILALDTEHWKLEELKKRAKRAGVSAIIEVKPIDNNKTIKRLYDSADRLLLDVPCSGLGVLRRNPDAKWKLDLDFLHKVRAIQAQILEEYSPICKIGGKMVYATCSILPSENQQQVEKFLSKHSESFRLLDEKIILPQENGFDGFYMACLERVR